MEQAQQEIRLAERGANQFKRVYSIKKDIGAVPIFALILIEKIGCGQKPRFP